MKFISFAHRNADAIINYDEELHRRYEELKFAISKITDEELIQDFLYKKKIADEKNTSFKSISHSINTLLKNNFMELGDWESEVCIFNDTIGLVTNTEWRLDFACENGFAVEVAFNHGEAICWNLLKPCLASELNHVEKAIQTRMGVYICATSEMKKAGNFDSASGEYEKVIRYLKPMMNQLTTPMMIIGLEPPETFYIDKKTKEIVYK